MSLAEKLRKKGIGCKPDVRGIQKKMAELEKRRGKMWKPRDGRNVVRILPAATKDGFWYHETAFHYGPGVVCGRSAGQKCPVCRYREKLLRSTDEGKLELANALEPQNRILFNLVDLTDDSSKAKGVQVWGHSETTLNKLIVFFNDAEWGDFTDPIHGYDIIIEKTDRSGPEAYKIRPRRNPSKIEKLLWLKEMKRLDRVQKVLPYTEAKKRLKRWISEGGVKYRGRAQKLQQRGDD